MSLICGIDMYIFDSGIRVSKRVTEMPELENLAPAKQERACSLKIFYIAESVETNNVLARVLQVHMLSTRSGS